MKDNLVNGGWARYGLTVQWWWEDADNITIRILGTASEFFMAAFLDVAQCYRAIPGFRDFARNLAYGGTTGPCGAD